jgi:hypothetical protein
MKNFFHNFFLVNSKTNIELILTHVSNDNNRYRILIKSNYSYLLHDDIQLVTNKIIELIAPTTKYEYNNKLWWRISLYTINNNSTKIKVLSELINFSINIEGLIDDYLSKDNIETEHLKTETFFLVELTCDPKIKITN